MVKVVKNIKTTNTKTQSLKISSPNSLPGGKLNNFLNNFPDKLQSFIRSKNFYFLLLAVGLALLIIFKRSWFVAAIVNGSPITNFELQTKLNQQFKSQVLNQLIEEKIILSEAQKMNAIPTAQEIETKITEIETQVGGKETFESLLVQQGLTRTSLKERFKTQLSMMKLYENEATVSAQEVAQYLEQNKDTLTSTDSAQLEKDAREAIKNQKLSGIFSEKFQELRTKAKIQTF